METKGSKQIIQEQRRLVVESYHSTLSVVMTAEALGLSKNQVRGELKRQSIPLSRATGRGACYHHIEEIKTWAAAGVSLSEIGRRVGTNKNRVRDFLQKHGFERKTFHQTMENNPRWKGGRMIDADGYILIKQPSHPNCDRHGYVRASARDGKTMGRFLDRLEVVHHKDQNKQNNHPDNLEVFGSNAAHLSETLQGKCPNWTPQGAER
jgi:hypothetical protein